MLSTFGTTELESPVRVVEQTNDGVIVRSEMKEVRARFAIFALAPKMAARIAVRPGLPESRTKLQEGMPMGSVIKFVSVYERAFWRESGYSGEAISRDAAVRMCFDGSSPDNAQPALIGFVVADRARELSRKSVDERKAVVLNDLARFFGEAARKPIEYADKDWLTDPWSAGCYVGLMPPGLMTMCGQALRQPLGRIHFAGTETAVRWTGYLDGAIEAGERAAAEVAVRLSLTPEDRPKL